MLTTQARLHQEFASTTDATSKQQDSEHKSPSEQVNLSQSEHKQETQIVTPREKELEKENQRLREQLSDSQEQIKRLCEEIERLRVEFKLGLKEAEQNYYYQKSFDQERISKLNQQLAEARSGSKSSDFSTTVPSKSFWRGSA